MGQGGCWRQPVSAPSPESPHPVGCLAIHAIPQGSPCKRAGIGVSRRDAATRRGRVWPAQRHGHGTGRDGIVSTGAVCAGDAVCARRQTHAAQMMLRGGRGRRGARRCRAGAQDVRSATTRGGGSQSAWLPPAPPLVPLRLPCPLNAMPGAVQRTRAGQSHLGEGARPHRSRTAATKDDL